MQVTLLGTGCPVAHVSRFGPANLVQTPNAAVLIDCGSGVTQRLVAAGVPGRRIDALLLTHLHSDHIVDLYQFIVSSWHQGRERPHRIFGPPGTRAYVDGLMALWETERTLRIAHEKRPSTTGLQVDVTEIGGGTDLFVGDLSIAVVDVMHQPVKSAFGFVFRDGRHTAALSGDTAYCPALIEAARGAALLVHEVFIHREMPVVAGVRTAETVAAVGSYHTRSDEVGAIAREAGVACLALNHFVPPDFDKEALLSEVRRSYAGPIFVGEDLMRFDLSAASVRWNGAVSGYTPYRPAAASP